MKSSFSFPNSVKPEVKTVFELNDPFRMVVLPKDSGQIIKYFDGTKSLSEIIRLAWEESGSVRFKDLFVALEKLEYYECFDGFRTNMRIKTRGGQSLLFKVRRAIKPFLVFRVSSVHHGLFKKFNLGFWALAILMMVFGGWELYCQRALVENDFLKINGSYFFGILFFLAANSVLLSLKHLVKFALLTFENGKLPRSFFSVSLWSVAFQVYEDDQIQKLTKGQAAAFTLASILTPFFFIWVADVMGFEKLVTHLNPVAILIAVVDLDPYISSELTRLFKRFYAKHSLEELIPYLRRKSLVAAFDHRTGFEDQNLFGIFASIGFAWAFTTILLGSRILNQNLPNLLLAFANGSPVEKLGAGIILAGMISIFGYLIVDLGAIIFSNALQPFVSVLMKMQRRFKSGRSRLQFDDARQLIGDMDFFRGVNEATLKYIISRSSILHFAKGARLIIQDSPAREMFIILSGSVEVIKREPTGLVRRLADIQAPTVVGEMALLFDGVRTADVEAKTSVNAIILRHDILEFLRQGCDRVEFSEMTNKIILQQYLSSAALFNGLPKEMAPIFMSAGTFQKYKANETIITQGSQGDSFYLLLRGKVSVKVNNENRSFIDQGGFFGEISLLTGQSRNATIVASEESLVFKIESEKFWEILSRNLNLAMCIETLAEVRIKEDQHVPANAS